jgi:pSer/pThr/pTyr-binding forkhead associated (FHA) protein
MSSKKSMYRKQMGPTPFRFMYKYHANPTRQEDLFQFVKENAALDMIPTLGYASLHGSTYYTVQSLCFTIGNNPENDVVIGQHGVDSVHLTIIYNEDQWEFHVCGRVGCHVNDYFFPMNSSAQLEDGDVIQIVNWAVTFSIAK